jgi:hypothetical protein
LIVGSSLVGLAWLLAAEGAGAGTASGAAADGDMDADGDVASLPNRACLDGLRERGVNFVEWPTKGVRTPVKVLGAIGGVNLRSHDPRSTGKVVLMDCELARALSEAAAAFQALGVRELQYSGAYQYRTRRRSTRLSEHAHGLAIDVHAFVFDHGPRPAPVSASAKATAALLARVLATTPDVGGVEGGPDASTGGSGTPGGTSLATGEREPAPSPTVAVPVVAEVTRDFEPGVGRWAVTAQDDCIGRPRTAVGRALRTLACRLRASSIFREVITPDDNADHHDHFHLEAFPDALSRTRAVLARKPSVTDD